MNRRNWLEIILLAPLAATFSCGSSSSTKILSLKDFSKESNYIGTIDNSECYSFNLDGKDILILNRNGSTNQKYDFAKIDSLEIAPSKLTSGGKTIYSILRVANKK